MRFTLKDYQADAVGEVLGNLRKARTYYQLEKDLTSFSLTATTGAGKTVMAAAVIEALFFGNDDFNFEPDTGAVVLWFSDDPALNEQSRARLQQASSELDSRLVPIQTSFNLPKFEPRTVYFLNTQKLSKTSRLVRGHSEANNGQERLFSPRPDNMQNSIWDTITNTIQDEELTLYLILDEAHRGMGTTRAARAERSTIVHRLISGTGDVPPIPIVWGVSATVERFEDAMKGITGRTSLSAVQVDSAKVQASGLLKDDIVLDIPAETGTFDTVLLKRATRKLLEATNSWQAYATEQDGAEPVVPLMVVQVPNNSGAEVLREAIDTIRTEWPDLPPDAVANVFGDHKDLLAGQWPVPYIAPERVQDRTAIRVLFAKDAISTGWDCPRAEVLMSFRPAQDKTHITQLLGRMVRSPLARRIPSDDRLNSVDCLLPKFDRKTATEVASILMRGATGRDEDDESGTGGGTGRRVLFDPRTMVPVDEGFEAIWEKFLSLPSQTLPKKGAKPVKRLTALAQALSDDGLLPDAGAKAHSLLHSVLDGRAVQYADKVQKAVDDVMSVDGQTVKGRFGGSISYQTFSETADARVIRDAFRGAGRIFSADLARTYAEHLAGPDSDDDELRDAHVRVAALALVPDISEDLDHEAEKLAKQWFSTYRVAIKTLTDDRQQVYNDLLAMSTEPQRISLAMPKVRQEDTRVRDAAGNESSLPARTDHLLLGEDGMFPVDLNDWEHEVLDTEMKRPGAKAWYRNPARSNASSLAISYKDGAGTWKSLRPDFLFFSESNGQIEASIVDPHGHHLADAMPKLRGLAHYAETYGDDFLRIEAVAKVGGTLRVLDLKQARVRQAVLAGKDAKALYEGESAENY
ncbi:DEAD/DEAH box helicase family protein [Streptomyces sp. SID5770]|uniref:DEAD/DEAH box helicase n=1 Tax=Streptomyces sp. SID5770 TaxID=2690308 RepID=UPI00136C1B5A|nr:DEAD/DEAH box helicase family protein [Streptomyces sp. SID5770]MZE56042.1 DEAD/DEAH box helicase family protein [Streptomyces sp. SID5770]